MHLAKIFLWVCQIFGRYEKRKTKKELTLYNQLFWQIIQFQQTKKTALNKRCDLKRSLDYFGKEDFVSENICLGSFFFYPPYCQQQY